MSFLSTMDISTSALTAQRFRMDILSQNIANVDTTRTPEGGPYTRKLTVFQERGLNIDRGHTSFKTALEREAYKVAGGGVRVSAVIEDDSEFIPVYDPAHPDADEDGYVLMPNVDRAEETVDLMAATHSYNANITTLNIIKTMAMKAAELTK
ncbi:MAG: flagellar basal body rod protein FlgC [Ruminococcaceae bacterium]|nr:flagellar basal body rod protein FlgC [Oscillospiraceae bacterium]